MKNYFVCVELEENMPSYEFIIRAKTFKQAIKLAKKEIKEYYAEFWKWGNARDFTCYEITADELLKRLTIN